MTKRDTLRELAWAVIRGGRRYRLAANAQLRALGLSDATALPILILQRLGNNVRQGVLADELGVEGPSLVRVLDRLEEQGLVERREDPEDRRARLLNTTPSGREMSLKAEAALDVLRGKVFADISVAELTTCLLVLGRLSDQLDLLEAPGP